MRKLSNVYKNRLILLNNLGTIKNGGLSAATYEYIIEWYFYWENEKNNLLNNYVVRSLL